MSKTKIQKGGFFAHPLVIVLFACQVDAINLILREVQSQFEPQLVLGILHF